MPLLLVRILLLALLALEGALLAWGPQERDHRPAVEAALKAGDKPHWEDDASLGIRYAAWINLALLGVLLVTAQWWARPLTPSTASPRGRPAGRTGLWFWPFVLVAVAACLTLRLPLAGKSLWWDESWVMLQVTHGKWGPDKKKPGQVKFQAHDWKRAAFYYQKPTNHVPMSLAQKASLDTWRAAAGRERSAFSELAARAPALLASVASVVLLALLLRCWGRPGAGVVAALLLALHPWYVRYGVDARAYALVVPLCITGLYAVTRLFQTRGAAVLPWVAWGVVEFLWLWAYPNGVLDVAVLNLFILVRFALDGAVRWTAIFRLAATSLFAAIAFIQVFLPNLMQALRWAGSETVSQPLNQALLDTTWSQLLLGVELSWPVAVEAGGLVSSYAGLGFATFGSCLLTLLVLLGVLLLLAVTVKLLTSTRGSSVASRPGGAWILASVFLGTALFLLAVRLTGSYFYPRFIIALLPCLIATVCVLVADAVRAPSVPSPLPGALRHTRRWLAVLLAVALAVQVFPFWKAQAGVLRSRPYAPLRDVSAYVMQQDTTVPEAGRPLLVCYGHGHETLPLYLPGIASALSRDELEKLITQARSAQRGLLVIQGHSVHNRGSIPDGFTLLDDPALFTEEAAFAGIEPEFYFRVFRLKPAS